MSAGRRETTSGLAEPQTFRDAMALLVAPVTVVAMQDDRGRRWGFTASSVTSVSLTPPLLLVGLSHSSSCRPALLGTTDFTVNVLGAQHREVARRFATRGVDRFAGGEFGTWPGYELPCLLDAVAVFRCRRTAVLPAGDHDLVLGALVEVRTSPADAPLLLFRRDFHRPG